MLGTQGNKIWHVTTAINAFTTAHSQLQHPHKALEDCCRYLQFCKRQHWRCHESDVVENIVFIHLLRLVVKLRVTGIDYLPDRTLVPKVISLSALLENVICNNLKNNASTTWPTKQSMLQS